MNRIVGISDLHCGDIGAICPESFEGDFENSKPARDWLRCRWFDATEKFVPQVTQGDPFLLLLIGDLVQGNWSRFGGLMTKSVVKQCRMARELLAPLVKRAGAVIIVEGTEIHTGDDEEEIAIEFREMAGDKLILAPDGRAVHTAARFTMNGQTHTARHHTTVAGRVATEASGRGIHLADEQLRRVGPATNAPTFSGRPTTIATPALKRLAAWRSRRHHGSSADDTSAR